MKNYLLNHSKWQDSAEGADGFMRFLSFVVFNDNHFNKDTISSNGKGYDYFTYRDTPTRCSAFYERIMDLCSRSILRDPMGSDKRLVDIFGLTPNDLFHMDYASLIDLEGRVNIIETEHNRSMTDTAARLASEHAELQKTKSS